MEGIVAPEAVVFEIGSGVSIKADIENYWNELKFKFISEEFKYLKFKSGREICRNLSFVILHVRSIHFFEKWKIAQKEASKPIKRKLILQNAFKIM